MQGYGGGQRDKKDLIRNWIKRHDRTPTIILTQETWENNDDTETDKDDGILFFSNGKKKDDGNPRVKGGVGIILSKAAEEAWKKAGQPDPIRGQTVAKTTRNVGIEMQFEDTFKRKIKLFVISTYIPCSDKKYSDEDFNETLDELQTLIERCPKEAVLVIGGDFNSEIGTNNKDDDEKDEVTGIFRNARQNTRGEKIRNFLSINNLISTATFFKKLNYNTHCAMNDLETPTRQIDHIIIQKKEKKRMIDCNTENSMGIKSDHVPITLTIRAESSIPKKKKKGRKKKKDKIATTDDDDDKKSDENKKKKKDYSRIVSNKKEWNELISKNLLNDSNPPSNNETENDTNPNPSPQNTETEEEDDHYSLLQEVIETSTEELLAKIEEVNRKRPHWFVLSENKLKKCIEERNETLKEYMKEKTDDNKEKAKTKRKELKIAIYEAKERWLNAKAKEIKSK